MSDEDKVKMILAIAEVLDYDLYKSLNPETSDDPEMALIQLAGAIQVVDEYLN